MPAEERLPGVGEEAGDGRPAESALEVAVRFLAKRDRTVVEVRRRLAAAGIDSEEAESAIADLLEQGYLDDARYARRFAEDRRNLDGWGSARIERRLRELGLEADLVETAVRRSPQAELEGALQVLGRRFPVGRCAREERDRALGVLLRRGYDFELACDAVRLHARGQRTA